MHTERIKALHHREHFTHTQQKSSISHSELKIFALKEWRVTAARLSPRIYTHLHTLTHINTHLHTVTHTYTHSYTHLVPQQSPILRPHTPAPPLSERGVTSARSERLSKSCRVRSLL